MFLPEDNPVSFLEEITLITSYWTLAIKSKKINK